MVAAGLASPGLPSSLPRADAGLLAAGPAAAGGGRVGGCGGRAVAARLPAVRHCRCRRRRRRPSQDICHKKVCRTRVRHVVVMMGVMLSRELWAAQKPAECTCVRFSAKTYRTILS